MDYEELEFDLEILPDRIQGYESYIYLGEFNNFLNYNTDKIELLFRMDVLEGIIISLPLKEPEDVAAQLERLLGTPQIAYQQDYKLCKFDIKENFTICCYHSNSVTLTMLLKDAIAVKLLHSLRK